MAEVDGGLQASSPLLEMASLRLPDSEEFDFNSRRRGETGVLTSSSDPVHLTTRSQPNRHFHNFSRAASETASGMITATFGNINYINHTLAEEMADQNGGLYNDNSTVGNSTNSTVVPEFFYRHSFAMTAVYCVAYLLVFAVGLVGNCFVIAVVYRSPRMRTVTNFFIVNLAVADILVIVFCLPATLMSNIFVRTIFGTELERARVMLYVLNDQQQLLDNYGGTQLLTEQQLSVYLASGLTVLDHPPYSPDLAPCDFALFPEVKMKLRGRRFASDEQLLAARDQECENKGGISNEWRVSIAAPVYNAKSDKL
ncbi:uncharacterized protein [Anabrus simplex]|uniref:uncharacterized protein n=1 Tax=Anabrus simplex TaxID=316456 RepID=UPI0035A2AB01